LGLILSSSFDPNRINMGTKFQNSVLRVAQACAIAVALLPVASAHAGTSAVRGEAVVVRPLSFITDENLEFGTIISAGTAGTVTVPPSGARTKTGGPILHGTAFQPARFSGFGARNQFVLISTGANSYSVPRIGGGAPAMTLDTFVIGSTPTANLTVVPRSFRITSATGLFNFPVGARLRVAANQPAGQYQTSFTITLVYQ
jgi:Domain of unknown function (DUF4402)